jgi:uncharacterized protein (DUF2062 family)
MIALVPVYNHAATVGAVVSGLVALGAPVLAVDDGSSDGSGEAAQRAGAELLRLPANQGKGAALRAGMALARERGYRQCLTCDADGQHPATAVELLAEAAGDPAAIHVGVRDMAGAPPASRFGQWWSNLWTWIACGRWPGDSQSGLRVYPLPSICELPVAAGRYAFEVEVLVRAVWAGLELRPVAVPVLYPADRVSHFHKLKDNLRTAATFHRLVWRRMIPLPHRMLIERPRPRLRDLLLSGLQPWPAAGASALGAAIGVAPVPGLQFALTAFLAWRLGLNLPLALFTSNLSFGPLLFVWGAISSSLGVWLRTGQSPWVSYHAIFQDFAARGGTAHGIGELVRTFFLDWLLGATLVVPTVAVIVGAIAYVVARAFAVRART